MSESVRFALVVFLVASVVLLVAHALGMWFVAIGSEGGVTFAFGPVTMYFYPDLFPAHNR